MMFNKHIRRNIEVYIDDMMVKIREPNDHIKDLEEIFKVISNYKMRLNPKKYVFRVESEWFLRCLVSS